MPAAGRALIFLLLCAATTASLSANADLNPPPATTPAQDEAWERLRDVQALGPETLPFQRQQKLLQRDVDLWLGNLFPAEVRRQKKGTLRFTRAYLALLPGSLRLQHPALKKKGEARQRPCTLTCLLQALAAVDPAAPRGKGKKLRWAGKKDLLPPGLASQKSAAALTRGEAAEIVYRYWKARRGEGAANAIRALGGGARWRSQILSRLRWKEKPLPPPPLGRPTSLAWLYADVASRTLWSAEEYQALLARLKSWGVGGVVLSLPAEVAAAGGFHWPIYPFTPAQVRQMIETAQGQGLQVVLAPRLRDLSAGNEGGVGLPAGFDQETFAAVYQEFVFFHALLAQDLAANAVSLGDRWERNLARYLCHSQGVERNRLFFKGQWLTALSLEDIDTVADTCLRRADLFEVYESKMREAQVAPAEKVLSSLGFLAEQTAQPILWRLSLRPAFEEKGIEVKLDQEILQGLGLKVWFGGQVLPACPLRLPHLAEGKSPVLGAAWTVTCTRPWPL